jgi:ectoine hydroxylase
MKLSPEQREQFDREGYLFFLGLFSRDETKVLIDAVPELYARRDICNVREKDSDAVRTNFAAHLYSVPFAKLALQPLMVDTVRDLLV